MNEMRSVGRTVKVGSEEDRNDKRRGRKGDRDRDKTGTYKDAD